MGETWQYVFSILSLLCLGGAAGWFLLRRQNRKLKAETEKIDSDKALSVTGAADQRLVDLLTT